MTGTDHQARMLRVLDYIDAHIDDRIDLDRLSDVAAFSKFHFHRQFRAVFGLSVFRYVHLLRLKRAANQLVYRADRITDIAMDAGYDSPDAFGRAFRKHFGGSPSDVRRQSDMTAWTALFAPLDTARSFLMSNTPISTQVTVKDVAPVKVAIMEHRGNPATIGQTLRDFIAWRKKTGLSPSVSRTFNVFYSDPEVTPSADFRLDLCASVRDTFSGEGEPVRIGEIPAGRCAVMTVKGGEDRLAAAATYLYRDWLPASGESLRDFPLYFERRIFYPDVPEADAVTDVCLPLA